MPKHRERAAAAPAPPPAPVSVRVCEPADVRSGLTSHVTYRVLTLCPHGHPHAGVHDARRRYSDFDLLHRALQERYIGLVVPPLPAKDALFGFRGAGFAERRLRGLALFAERLARAPTLLLDSLSSAFFGLPEADEWEEAVRKAHATRFHANINPGQLRWQRLLGSVALPEEDTEVERLAAAAHHEIKLAAEQLASIERALEACIATSAAHAESMASLATAAAEWGRLEDCEVHTLNALPASAGGPSAGGGARQTQAERPGSPRQRAGSPKAFSSMGGGRQSPPGCVTAGPSSEASSAAAIFGGADGAAGVAAANRRGYTPGMPSALAALLSGFSGFLGLESRLQSAQPPLLEQLFLETVRFERRVLLEALAISEKRNAVASATFKAREAVRSSTGAPRPKDVSRLSELAVELEVLNKGFLFLEVPRLAEARLHSAVEISGHLLAVRSAHAGLLLQAAESFFLVASGGSQASTALPPQLRPVMQPPLLLATAGTILGDAGSIHALITATPPAWCPPIPEAAREAGQILHGSHEAAPAQAAPSASTNPSGAAGVSAPVPVSGGGGHRRRSGRRDRGGCRASSPTSSLGLASSPTSSGYNTALSSSPPSVGGGPNSQELPPALIAPVATAPPPPPPSAPPVTTPASGVPDEVASPTEGRRSLLDDIRRRRSE